MVNSSKLRKCIISIVFLMLMLGMVFGQTPSAFAKTLQTPIANPPNDTVVLNVQIGGATLPYTWGDLTGSAGYKFGGKATTDTYLYEVPHDSCEGIKISDLLSDIESTLGIMLQDDYKIRAVCSDGYYNESFTVGEAKNYTTNHYLLANKVNGVSEACFGYRDSDPSVTYPATYLRVARNRGGDYATDVFGNTAYMRLINSLQLTRSDGSAVELLDVNLAQNNGTGLSTLSPAAAGLVIGGTGISKGKGLLGSFVYLNQAQVDFIKANKSVAGLGLGSSWTSEPTLYSSYDNHGTPEYTYTLAEGIKLKAAMTALGADVTSASIAIEATAADYSQIVDDAFGKNAGRNYIAPDGSVGAAVDPILIFYDDQVSTSTPDASTVLPTTTAAIMDPNPLFAYGQKYATESNNCSFVKNTCKIRAGLDTPAFTVTRDSTTKTISLSDIALLGIYQTSYFWEDSGTQVTQSVVGAPLKAVLSRLGIEVPSDKGLVINVNNGNGTVASSRTVSYDELGKCFVAYDAFENSRRIAGSVKPLRIYCPGQTRASVLVENVVGATVSAASAKGDYNGDSTVNIQDVVLTVNCVLGSATPTPAQFSAADYNSDGSVNIQDVVMIVNKALGN